MFSDLAQDTELEMGERERYRETEGQRQNTLLFSAFTLEGHRYGSNLSFKQHPCKKLVMAKHS